MKFKTWYQRARLNKLDPKTNLLVGTPVRVLQCVSGSHAGTRGMIIDFACSCNGRAHVACADSDICCAVRFTVL